MFAEKNKKILDTMGGIQLADDMKSISLFKDREKLLGKTVNVRGFLVTKPSKYGSSVLVVIEPIDGIELLYLPERYVDEFRDFNEEEVTAITSGHLALTNFREVETKNGMTVLFDYADR